MWFLPLLVVGAIAMAVARKSRKPAPPSRQLSAPAGLPGAPGVPGPISVLGEILRVGQTPPPTVLLCAIAEAQSIGRNDLASDIVQVFIAPVVYHHQRTRGRGSRSMNYERGSCEITRSPRYTAEAAYTAPPRSPFAAPAARPPEDAASMASPEASSLMQQASSSMDDEINALLHADPARFMEMVSRSGTFHAPQAPLTAPLQAAPSASPAPIHQPMGLPPDVLAQMQETASSPQTTNTPAPGSPIPGVPDPAWQAFVSRLARESPQFSSSRHVGQYRQRRERLAELGINPSAIADSPQAQRTALDVDLADAYRHGSAGDLFAEHLGRPISLPGREGAETITLSGVLGVIQCAGLEGAVGWLERSNDRKRYPHTTQAFTNTNGAF